MNFLLVLILHYLLRGNVVTVPVFVFTFTQNKIIQGHSLRHMRGSVLLHISNDSNIVL